jgi:hypothetical protein
MARIPGRNGRLYVGITSAGTAEPIAFVAKVGSDMQADVIEVTALGDVNKTYVTGLADFKGTYSGFYDDATAQTFKAAVDGIARKFYFYPDLGTATRYVYGTATFGASLNTDVAGAVEIGGSFAASGPCQTSW